MKPLVKVHTVIDFSSKENKHLHQACSHYLNVKK